MTNQNDINWLRCFLCQTVSNETLQCPAEVARTNSKVGAGYEAFVSNFEQFVELESLPMEINVAGLDDGSGMVSTLMANKAKWHKTCKNRYIFV